MLKYNSFWYKDDEINQQEIFESILSKRIFTNSIEDQREYTAIFDKRRYLARIKFEEHCEPKGEILERICPILEQCLLPDDQSKLK